MEVNILAKIIALSRRNLSITLGVVLVMLIAVASFSLWTHHEAVNKVVIPEIKMLSLSINPQGPIKDVTYGSVTLKGSQIIPSKSFEVIVNVQNTTAQKMMNIPVELEVTLVGDEKQKITKLANLSTLDPGGTAKVTFGTLKALGDAQGKNPSAGLHQLKVRVKPNPAGGVNQTTEANFRFNVDSTVKVPVTK